MYELLDWYFSPDVTFDAFKTWYESHSEPNYQTNSENMPSLDQALNNPNINWSKLSALRPELGLMVVNFIREQGDRILERSQKCYPSPVKTPHPSIYTYSSPVKTHKLAETNKSQIQSNRPLSNTKNQKKRVQLFSTPNNDKNISNHYSEDDHFDMKKLDHGNDKISKLEERCSGSISPLKKDHGELKILTSNEKKVKRGTNCRRSLDSLTEGPNRNRSSGHKTKATSPINLADFITSTPNSSSSKQNKNRRKKIKSSYSPVQAQETRTKIIQVSSNFSNLLEEGESFNEEKNTIPIKPNITKTLDSSNEISITNQNNFSNLEDYQQNSLINSSLTTSEKSNSLENHDLWNQIKTNIDKTKQKVNEIDHKILLRTPPKENLVKEGSKVKRLIVADPAKVTYKELIDKLVSLYCYCIDSNMILNLAVELYLLSELLSSQEIAEEEEFFPQKDPNIPLSEQKILLNTVHNCVYFACQIFSKQKELLRFFDQDTLLMLIKCQRIEFFVPKLIFHLENYLTSVSKETSKNNRLDGAQNQQTEVMESVRFHTETDSVSNFPSDRAFQDFKKQRDLFYEILRSWKSEKDMFEGRKFKDRFGLQIYELLNTQIHPTNMLHLAKLFCEQLVVTCSIEDMELLPNVNPQLIKCLEKRFGQNSNFNVQNEKIFYGAELFFKEFLLNCQHFAFLTHLKKILIEFVELKEIEFEEISRSLRINQIHKEIDSSILNQISSKFCSSLATIRIAGKFLGFIESIPFHCQQDSLSESMLSEQLKTRDKEPPPLDLIKLVRRSLQQKRIVSTIPWVVEFCSSLDPVALQSRYFQGLFKLLSHIYKAMLKQKKYFPCKIDSLNIFYLKLVLGEFFENPLIPREFFFNYSSKSVIEIERILHECVETESANIGLDEVRILQVSMVHSVSFPYMIELKRVLMQFKAGEKTSGNLIPASQKHKIQKEHNNRLKGRKVPTEFNISFNVSSSFSSDNLTAFDVLQAKLEGNFFHNHQGILLKSVNFIADNIAYKIISKISTHNVMNLNFAVEAHFRDCFSLAFQGNEVKNMDNIKAELITELHELTLSNRICIEKEAHEMLGQGMHDLINKAVTVMLPEDMSPSTIESCQVICERKAAVQVMSWVKEHLTERFFLQSFQKIFNKEWRTACINNELGVFKNKSLSDQKIEIELYQKLNGTYSTPSKILAQMNELAFRASINDNLEVDEVKECIENAKKCVLLQESYEIPSMGINRMNVKTVSLALNLLISNPEVMSSNLQEAFLNFWESCVKNSKESISSGIIDKISRIISSENLFLFQKSKNSSQLWIRLEHLITRLLNAELLVLSVIEANCLELSKKEWPSNVLSHLASCLKGVLDSWQKRNRSKYIEVVGMIDFLAWLYQQVQDDFDQDFPEL